MLSKIKISIVSNVTRLGQINHNLEKMEQTIIEALNRGERADLYLFPELNITGGFFSGGMQANTENYRRLGEQVPTGPSCQNVARMARQYQTHICAGLVEREGDRYFITHILFGPQGLLIHQRKLFPQDPMRPLVFSAGQRLNTVDLLGHRCAILACADWMEVETTILAGLEEVALILAPTGGGFEDHQLPVIWKLICSKALSTEAFIAAAFGHYESSGPRITAGMVLDPNGEVLISGTRFVNEDAVFTIDITPHPPGKRWGGFKARASLLAQNLCSYLPACSEVKVGSGTMTTNLNV